ncbi:MAG TPA: acyltransferase [Candidatus Acidoferrum sp.]|nr:acyltransferase [Candidatus Acidoferrum sp.]
MPTLTSLRFFAALHVFCFHLVAFRILTGRSLLYHVASIGYVGVSLFFVLSGFILVYTYAGRSVPAREFWRARFARIYPAYVFSLVVTAPLFLYAVFHARWLVIPWPVAHLKLGMFLQATLLHAWVPPATLMWNAVSWSLSVEAFFYLAFPYLVKRFARLSLPGLVLLGVFAWFATIAITTAYTILNPDGLPQTNLDTYNAFWLGVVKFNPLVRLPEFVTGMACGLLFLRARPNPKLALPLVSAGLLACGIVVYFSARIPYPMLHSGLLAPAFAAVIYALALQSHLPTTLNLRPMVLLGNASYSFYLLHYFLLWLLFFRLDLGFSRWGIGGVLLCLAIICGVSILVYLFLEQPMRRKLRGAQETAVAIEPVTSSTEQAAV